MRVVTCSQMKQIEQNSLNYDLTFHRLMENAGSAAAAFIRRTFNVQGLNCMVFCAKGNNGGDGLVAARKLSEHGANIVIVMLDGIPRSQESAAMYQMVLMMDLPMVDFSAESKKVMDFLAQTDIIVDAICGTGFSGRLHDTHRQACRAINSAVAAVVSLDVPTGVECDTGACDPDAVKADFTVVFDSPKPVHALPGAQAFLGKTEVVDIGIPEEAHQGIGTEFDPYAPANPLSANVASTAPPAPLATGPANDTEIKAELEFSFVAAEEEEEAPEVVFVSPEPLAEAPSGEPEQPSNTGTGSPSNTITLSWVLEQLPPRRPDCHKGTFGHLLVIAGSQNYRGAATLTTLSALRSGAGLVTLAATSDVCAATSAHILEATYLPLAQSAVGGIDSEAAFPQLEKQLPSSSAIVFGCGLGNTVHTARLLAFLLEHAQCPVVIDADGINALAENIHVLHKASAPVIVTPHPGEMARLCGVSIEKIQQNREHFARHIAHKYGVTLILKGPGTLIATPDGTLLYNTTGNPGLAKGGSGDILSGIIGAFLAQALPPLESGACAVHLHGLAADRCAARRSQCGMLPSELLEDLVQLFLENGR